MNGPPKQGGVSWSAYWATRTYAERVLHYFGTNLIAHWPLDETSGTVARAIGGTPVNNNICPNEGFEGSITGWTATGGTVVKTTEAGEFRSGAAAAKVTASGNAIATMLRRISVIPGKTYILKFWYRGDGEHTCTYAIAREDYGAYVKAPTALGVAGVEYTEASSGVITAPAGFYTIYVEIRTQNVTGAYVCVDDVSLIPTEDINISYLDGNYKNVTLNQEGFRSGENSIYVPGTNPSGVSLSMLITKEFPRTGNGTLLIWMKPDIDALTDGISRYMVKFKTTPISENANYVDLFKHLNNNTIGSQFKDDTMDESISLYTLSESIWICYAVTWSAEVGVKRFINGVQYGNTVETSGSWSKIFDGWPAIGAEAGTLVGGMWKGYLSHCVLGKTALSDEAMLYLGQPL